MKGKRRRHDPEFKARVALDPDGESQHAASPDKKRFAVGDKGYHKNEELAKLVKAGLDPIIAEPRGREAPKRNKSQAKAFEANRDNRQCEHGRELMRSRGEKVERSFRHMLDHGGARRTTLSGHIKIAKRILITAFGFNRSIYSWHVHGAGTVKQCAAGNHNQEFHSCHSCALHALIRPASGLLGMMRKILSLLANQSRPPRQTDLHVAPVKSVLLLS